MAHVRQEVAGERLLIDLLQAQHVGVVAQHLLLSQRLPILRLQVPAAQVRSGFATQLDEREDVLALCTWADMTDCCVVAFESHH